MPRIQASSADSRYFKVIAPTVWISAFSIWTAVEFRDGDPQASKTLVTTVVGTLFFLYFAWRLKYVDFDEEFLYVTGFRTSASIPLSQVSGLGRNYLFHYWPVVVHLRERSRFGRSIMFIPRKHGLFSADRRVLEYFRWCITSAGGKCGSA